LKVRLNRTHTGINPWILNMNPGQQAGVFYFF
jgi:hypothetical protein